jgi:osmotically-inducible protein OsmY
VQTTRAIRSLLNSIGRVSSKIDYRTRRDQVVAGRLQHAFERDLELARVQGLNFFVQNGVVTLYGTIRHELDRELISGVVRGVAGVRDVVEHIQVIDGGQAGASDNG